MQNLTEVIRDKPKLAFRFSVGALLPDAIKHRDDPSDMEIIASARFLLEQGLHFEDARKDTNLHRVAAVVDIFREGILPPKCPELYPPEW